MRTAAKRQTRGCKKFKPSLASLLTQKCFKSLSLNQVGLSYLTITPTESTLKLNRKLKGPNLPYLEVKGPNLKSSKSNCFPRFFCQMQKRNAKCKSKWKKAGTRLTQRLAKEFFRKVLIVSQLTVLMHQ